VIDRATLHDRDELITMISQVSGLRHAPMVHAYNRLHLALLSAPSETIHAQFYNCCGASARAGFM
jgi:hypothetical protein